MDAEVPLPLFLAMTPRNPPHGAPPEGDVRFRGPDWSGVAGCAILAAGTMAAYSRTFGVPLLLDDTPSIVDNSTIRRLWPLYMALSPPSDSPVAGRPLLNLSFAFNYALGGTSVTGYHLVNLLVHILAGWILFGLIRRTLLRPAMAERFGALATPLALTIAAIWSWHPLQTESVTYLSQRAESLMGLFYLLTLYGFTRGAASDDRRSRIFWFSVSALSCIAGVGSKEVIVTAPLMVFLYHRTFVAGGFRDAWRRHWPLHAVLAATWLPLLHRMIDLPHAGIGFKLGAAWWDYGLEECRVILKYALLVFWPNPLVFDYGLFVPPRFSRSGLMPLCSHCCWPERSWRCGDRRRPVSRPAGFS